MKLTKRRGFNFFRSYYDVYNELPDKDKIKFIDALLDRQFLGIKPKDLTGMALFAYISQTNSIDSQVKGYEDKTGIILTPCQGGDEAPSIGGVSTPSLQVEEKGKVEEEVNIIDSPSFLDFWNKYDKKVGKPPTEKQWHKVKQSDREKIMLHLDEYTQREKEFRKDPERYLKNKTWDDEIVSKESFNGNHLGRSQSLPAHL